MVISLRYTLRLSKHTDTKAGMLMFAQPKGAASHYELTISQLAQVLKHVSNT